jgi:glycosyltransferase involved in cell wall biosynthesis
VNNPLVSILIPTYNRAALLTKAIQSVLSQTYSEFELIIIDDASTDHTAAIVENFHDSRIHYLRLNQNGGVSAARNAGLKVCRGDYIAFLDSDDEWVPQKLEQQLQLFQNSAEQVGVIYSTIKVINGDNIYQKKNQGSITGSIYENLLYQNFVGTPSSVIVKKNCFTPGIFFDPSLRCCEDWDVWLQIARQWQFACITEPLIIYREHDDTQRGSTNSHAIVEGHLRFLQRHHTPEFLTHILKMGTFSAKQKADYLMNIARRLVFHAAIINHSEAVELAKQYFYLAYKTYPVSQTLLFHYLKSRAGAKFYVQFQKVESNIRRWGRSVLNLVHLKPKRS